MTRHFPDSRPPLPPWAFAAAVLLLTTCVVALWELACWATGAR